ncbi:restriction endonuclease [Rhodanobacter aciditrophus]|uniref:Restriction endonuclease n=2 Tax=Bacteria TaxID=2 RepID=A0ABW4B2A8_9GAMM
MIPNYQQFMRPFLEVAYQAKQQGKEEVRLRDVIDVLAEQFELSEEERSELLPSGRQRVIDNRIGWARTYLTKAGLLEATRRAHFSITDQGIQAVKSKETIDNAYLNQFEKFIAFKLQSNNDSEKLPLQPPLQTESLNDDDITPDEALLASYRKINDALVEDILERTRKVTPAFFEHLLINLLLSMGYGSTKESTAHALGKSGDNGVDGVINQDPLGVDQIYIQAKRYAETNKVGAGEIRDFFGALNLKNAQKGLFITTSDFTASAKDTAHQLSSRIVLVNGKELAKLMLRYNIGSRDEQTLHLKKIDEEFFEG